MKDVLCDECGRGPCKYSGENCEVPKKVKELMWPLKNWKRAAEFWRDQAEHSHTLYITAEAEAQFWRARYEGSDLGRANLSDLQAASLSMCTACGRNVIGDPGAADERPTETMQETVDRLHATFSYPKACPLCAEEIHHDTCIQ